MHTAPHLEFAPPPPPGAGRAVFLALFIHGLLVLALTWGIHWQNDPQDLGVEAELWAAVPQTAAPKAQPTPPPVEEVVKPKPQVKPEPPPPVKEVAPPKPTVDPQIAIDKQKKKEAENKAREEAKDKKRKEAEEAKAKKEKEAKEQAQRQAEEERQAEDRRKEDEKRIKALADAAGNATDTGQSVKAAGASANYLGRLRARVKRNIVFTDSQLQSVAGNPAAEVEVICSPSGEILSAKLTVSSKNEAWDQAVLDAIEKTGSLPRDENGKMPSKISFTFKPRD